MRLLRFLTRSRNRSGIIYSVPRIFPGEAEVSKTSVIESTFSLDRNAACLTLTRNGDKGGNIPEMQPGDAFLLESRNASAGFCYPSNA
jgi:hypothetical protein